MYGAVLGDIIGSRFEFDRGPWTKDFQLFTREDSVTDDTVMTVAVAEALLAAGKDATEEEIMQAVTDSMQTWGRKYPGAGYGGRFRGWLLAKNPKPYNSWGNGSAMRVSAAGWLYDSLDRTRQVARATAAVSHNHPEGIKGAECTAAVIFLAREHMEKEIIKEYVTKVFGYDLSMTVTQLQPLHRHDESCQDTLPKALISFLEGESYEDVVRNAVSLGGDTDTIAAIAGAMAEAYFGIPAELLEAGKQYIPRDLQQVIDTFLEVKDRHADTEEDPRYLENATIHAALTLMATEEKEEERVKLFYQFLNFLAERMAKGGEAPTPFIDVDQVIGAEDILTCQNGEYQLAQDLRLRMDTMTDSEDRQWLPLFTGNREISKGKVASIIMNFPIEEILRKGLADDSVEGVVINPFGRSYIMTKDLLRTFLSDYDSWKEQEEKEKLEKEHMAEEQEESR